VRLTPLVYLATHTPNRDEIIPRLDELRAEVQSSANPDDAVHLQRFFKTGPGEYGQGDRFLGIRIPVLRGMARRYRGLPGEDLLALLRSEWHEERMLALLLMVQEYAKAPAERREEIYHDYLGHTAWVNNWDLVDGSAAQIVGAHLADRDRKPLVALAESESVWERRIAIIATLHFIRRGEFGPTLELAGRLLADRHDLIHKAVGWMLREVGERDRTAEEAFLQRHQASMPRTMLRYAIEKLPEPRRKWYLQGCPA
jgi:3-methyladenine DNA glycosylase AlkD